MKYKVELQQITLKDAVDLMDNSTVFYTYAIGRPIFLLDNESLATSIRKKAIYLTPCSYVEKDDM